MSRESQNLHIDYLEIYVTEIEPIKAFFHQVFNWTFEDFGPDYSSFNDGQLNGGFCKVPESSPGGALIVFYALDLEAVLSKVEAAGGKITKEIFAFPGGRRFHFSDPLANNEFAIWTDQGC